MIELGYSSLELQEGIPTLSDSNWTNFTGLHGDFLTIFTTINFILFFIHEFSYHERNPLEEQWNPFSLKLIALDCDLELYDL